MIIFPFKKIEKKYKNVDEYRRSQIKDAIIKKSTSFRNGKLRFEIPCRRIMVIAHGKFVEGEDSLKVLFRVRYQMLGHVILLFFLFVFGFAITAICLADLLSASFKDLESIPLMLLWWLIYVSSLLEISRTADSLLSDLPD